jgi:hypothetical protein
MKRWGGRKRRGKIEGRKLEGEKEGRYEKKD